MLASMIMLLSQHQREFPIFSRARRRLTRFKLQRSRTRLQAQRKRMRIHLFEIFGVLHKFLPKRRKLCLHALDGIHPTLSSVAIELRQAPENSLWTDRFPSLDPFIPRPLAKTLRPQIRRETKHDEILYPQISISPNRVFLSRGSHSPDQSIDPRKASLFHQS